MLRLGRRGRTQSGTFKDGDLLVNKDGLRIVPQSEEGEVNQPTQPGQAPSMKI